MSELRAPRQGQKIVAIVSGGLDSITMLYWLHSYTPNIRVMSFNYGQRHHRELEAASDLVARLELQHDVVDLSDLRRHLRGSALTDDAVAVPLGSYTDASMRLTVVPNRNAIMLAIATATAVVERASWVAYAAHAGDHAIYPDCRPEFVAALSSALALGNEGFAAEDFEVVSPFLRLTKAAIVALGFSLRVPFERTWSCYVGERLHCGECGTCVERREAFSLAGIPDPTSYAHAPANAES